MRDQASLLMLAPGWFGDGIRAAAVAMAAT
jgi:hypothetical protein